MSRHAAVEQTRMRRAHGKFAQWELVRPDKTCVVAPFMRRPRSLERLMREVIDDADLKVTYRRRDTIPVMWTAVHTIPGSAAEARGESLMPNVSSHRVVEGPDRRRVDVFIGDPDEEPGEFSPFGDDGKLDVDRLKKEGWHVAGAMKDEGIS